MPLEWWDSKGLSTSGLTDLSVVFPRTPVNAAINHAAELARRHHDDRTRSVGVFHLFRLPSQLQSMLHRETIQLEQDAYFTENPEDLLWRELEGHTLPETAPQEGPVDLGKWNPNSQRDILRLAATYKAAFVSNFSCAPYFRLN